MEAGESRAEGLGLPAAVGREEKVKMTFRSSLWTSLPLCLPPGKPLSLIPLLVDPLLSADDTTHVKEGLLPVRRPAHTSSTKRPRGRGGQGPASRAVHSLLGARTIEGNQVEGVMGRDLGRGGRVEVSGANRQTSAVAAAEKYLDFEIAQRFSTYTCEHRTSSPRLGVTVFYFVFYFFESQSMDF